MRIEADKAALDAGFTTNNFVGELGEKLAHAVYGGHILPNSAKSADIQTDDGTLLQVKTRGTVAKLAMRQPFVLFKGLTFQKLCLPGAFRPGDHHNKMLRPGLCVVHASPQYL
ncbi:DUF6998 domain-containing protein [Klebsiella pneumoniae]|uniref:DUF6998 domain-containing protein n=1 Tax=Klebsiella pneumoniae TaxID=573 RepID=UPI003D188477